MLLHKAIFAYIYYYATQAGFATTLTIIKPMFRTLFSEVEVEKTGLKLQWLQAYRRGLNQRKNHHDALRHHPFFSSFRTCLEADFT